METIHNTTGLESQIIIRGQIADSSGHTDFAGTLDEAMELIMEQVTKAGKWVYINGNPFMFTNHSLAEQDEVRGMLAHAEDPTFMLTAKLQGGAATVRTKVTNLPMSQYLNSRKRAQMAVSVSTKNGKPELDVVISDFNGSKAKLSKFREQILAEMFKALAPVKVTKATAKQ